MFRMRRGVLGRDAARRYKDRAGDIRLMVGVLGAVRCFWARCGTPRRYKKYSVDRGLYTSARIERKNAPQPPCTQAVELFPILGLFGGLSSRRGRL